MIDVVAIAALSPLGAGDAAWSLGPIGAPAATRVRHDPSLEAAGLRKPFAARVELRRAGDPATALLVAAWSQLAGSVPRRAQVGLCVGSSSGAMATSEAFFAARRVGRADRALAEGATYHAPFRALVERVGERCEVARSAHLVTACSASTLAIGLAMGWLARGEVDYAIAGGYDALTVFVAAGFEALGATTASPPPRPFRAARDGLSLGEGAALFLLARPQAGRSPLARLYGFGASGDAVHLTAPDRSGGGLARAARRALVGTDPATVELVSVHGTSTSFNDPMEAKAIEAALGRPIGEVDVHAAKASIGHTLGAAGALETALVVDAIARGVRPATAGEGALDDEIGAHPRAVNGAGAVRRALKLSAAFGGANAALVLGATEDVVVATSAVAWRAREVTRVEVAETDDLARIAEVTGVARERLARMDGVCRLALLAVGALAAELGRDALEGAGIVLGSVLNTIDVNAAYDDHLRARGAAFAEGRRFAYTTPNASAGECAMAFGLTGPNLAVSRGVDAKIEAREVARDLIAGGDAERVVVVEVDAAGPAAREIAAATRWPVRFGGVARLLARV